MNDFDDGPEDEKPTISKPLEVVRFSDGKISIFRTIRKEFLGWFKRWPRLQKWMGSWNFLFLIFSMVIIYLCVFFVWPGLIQIGYASACYDNGMDYYEFDHTCINLTQFQIDKFFGTIVFSDHIMMTRWSVFKKYMLPPYTMYQEWDEHILELNQFLLEDWERLESEYGKRLYGAELGTLEDYINGLNSDLGE